MKFLKNIFLLCTLFFSSAQLAPGANYTALDQFEKLAKEYLQTINGGLKIKTENWDSNVDPKGSIGYFTYSNDESVRTAASILYRFKTCFEKGTDFFNYKYNDNLDPDNLFASISYSYVNRPTSKQGESEKLFSALFRSMCNLYVLQAEKMNFALSKADTALDQFEKLAKEYLQTINGGLKIKTENWDSNVDPKGSIGYFTYSNNESVRTAASILYKFKTCFEKGTDFFNYKYNDNLDPDNLFASISYSYVNRPTSKQGESEKLFSALFRSMCNLYAAQRLSQAEVPKFAPSLKASKPSDNSTDPDVYKKILLGVPGGGERPIYQNMIEAFVLGDAIGAMYEGQGFARIKEPGVEGLAGTGQHIIYKRFHEALDDPNYLVIDGSKKYYGPTDDTATSIAVGMSILNFDSRGNFVKRWADWLYFGHYEMQQRTGHSTGAGGNLKRFIVAFDPDRHKPREQNLKMTNFNPQGAKENIEKSVRAADSKHENNLGNGCLMKMLFSLISDLAENKEFNKSETFFQAKITHWHHEAWMSLQFIFELAKLLLENHSKELLNSNKFKECIQQVLEVVLKNNEHKYCKGTFARSIEEVLSEFETLKNNSSLLNYQYVAPGNLPENFWMIAPGLRASDTLQGVLLSLLLALHDLENGRIKFNETFIEQVLRRAIGLAGDTDSVAALAGMLAACMNVQIRGLNHQIPQEKIKEIWKINIASPDKSFENPGDKVYTNWIGYCFKLGNALINFDASDQFTRNELKAVFTHNLPGGYEFKKEAIDFKTPDVEYLVPGYSGYKLKTRPKDDFSDTDIFLPKDIVDFFYNPNNPKYSIMFEWWIDEVKKYAVVRDARRHIKMILEAQQEKITKDAKNGIFLTKDGSVQLIFRNGKVGFELKGGLTINDRVVEEEFRKYIRFLIADGQLRYSENKNRNELKTKSTTDITKPQNDFSGEYVFQVAKDNFFNGYGHFNEMVKKYKQKYKDLKLGQQGSYLAALWLYEELGLGHKLKDPAKRIRPSSSSPGETTTTTTSYPGPGVFSPPAHLPSSSSSRRPGMNYHRSLSRKTSGHRIITPEEARGILNGIVSTDLNQKDSVVFDLSALVQDTQENCSVYAITEILNSRRHAYYHVKPEEIEQEFCEFLKTKGWGYLVEESKDKLKKYPTNGNVLNFIEEKSYHISMFDAYRNGGIGLSWGGDSSIIPSDPDFTLNAIKTGGEAFILNITNLREEGDLHSNSGGSTHYVAIFFDEKKNQVIVKDSNLLKALSGDETREIYVNVIFNLKNYLEKVFLLTKK